MFSPRSSARADAAALQAGRSPAEAPAVNRRRPAARRAEAALALGAGLLGVVLVTIGFNRAWPLTLHIGAHDDRFIQGFYAAEHFGDLIGRWSMTINCRGNFQTSS